MVNTAELDDSKRRGILAKKFEATLDKRTSKICREHDQRIIPIDKIKIGVNAPPLHPYCRSHLSDMLEGWDYDSEDELMRMIEGKNATKKVDKTLEKKYNIDKRKLTEYALNPERQPNKARAFKEALGYDLSNYDELIQNVHSNLKTNEFKPKGKNNYGELFEQVLNLLGPNGKRANVMTGWIKKEDAIHLTSIYVTKKKRGDL
ncbi:DUF6883 domain-containing protein [Helcococcus ovis]|uniref:DUF6883 domain-containing protein n=2 Tax=Helcococcus ovis TaxID=72026 RepID=UPI001ADAD5D5|nr:DUF6883 domain-containing protein [Helcococcus ovis]WNZ00536.1 phage minor head protein [Helcococcus ovis]